MVRQLSQSERIGIGENNNETEHDKRENCDKDLDASLVIWVDCSNGIAQCGLKGIVE